MAMPIAEAVTYLNKELGNPNAELLLQLHAITNGNSCFDLLQRLSDTYEEVTCKKCPESLRGAPNPAMQVAAYIMQLQNDPAVTLNAGLVRNLIFAAMVQLNTKLSLSGGPVNVVGKDEEELDSDQKLARLKHRRIQADKLLVIRETIDNPAYLINLFVGKGFKNYERYKFADARWRGNVSIINQGFLAGIAETGACDEHQYRGIVETALLMKDFPEMFEGKTVSVVGDMMSSRGHSYIEVRGKNEEETIVIDAWGCNPPMLAKDHPYTTSRPEKEIHGNDKSHHGGKFYRDGAVITPENRTAVCNWVEELNGLVQQDLAKRKKWFTKPVLVNVLAEMEAKVLERELSFAEKESTIGRNQLREALEEAEEGADYFSLRVHPLAIAGFNEDKEELLEARAKLKQAIQHGNIDEVRPLIESCLDRDSNLPIEILLAVDDNEMDGALALALRYDNPEVTQFLYEMTFHSACMQEEPDKALIMRLLVKRLSWFYEYYDSEEPNTHIPTGYTRLRAEEESIFPEVYSELLLKAVIATKGEVLKEKDLFGNTIYHQLVITGQAVLLHDLVYQKGDFEDLPEDWFSAEPIDSRNNDGKTPLQLTVDHGQYECARILAVTDAEVAKQNEATNIEYNNEREVTYEDLVFCVAGCINHLLFARQSIVMDDGITDVKDDGVALNHITANAREICANTLNNLLSDENYQLDVNKDNIINEIRKNINAYLPDSPINVVSDVQQDTSIHALATCVNLYRHQNTPSMGH